MVKNAEEIFAVINEKQKVRNERMQLLIPPF